MEKLRETVYNVDMEFVFFHLFFICITQVMRNRHDQDSPLLKWLIIQMINDLFQLFLK